MVTSVIGWRGALLGSPRAGSVFPIPVRSALSARDYEEACAINAESSVHGLRLARQAFGLFPKLRQVDVEPRMAHSADRLEDG